MKVRVTECLHSVSICSICLLYTITIPTLVLSAYSASKIGSKCVGKPIRAAGTYDPTRQCLQWALEGIISMPDGTCPNECDQELYETHLTSRRRLQLIDLETLCEKSCKAFSSYTSCVECCDPSTAPGLESAPANCSSYSVGSAEYAGFQFQSIAKHFVDDTNTQNDKLPLTAKLFCDFHADAYLAADGSANFTTITECCLKTTPCHTSDALSCDSPDAALSGPYGLGLGEVFGFLDQEKPVGVTTHIFPYTY